MTTDELSEHGMVQMDEESIRGFLSSQSVGVLGLPTDGAPALRPMSFWFDDDSRLYFFYLTGSSSRKVELTDQATVARFLVYRAETTFNWRRSCVDWRNSVLPMINQTRETAAT